MQNNRRKCVEKRQRLEPQLDGKVKIQVVLNKKIDKL